MVHTPATIREACALFSEMCKIPGCHLKCRIGRQWQILALSVATHHAVRSITRIGRDRPIHHTCSEGTQVNQIT